MDTQRLIIGWLLLAAGAAMVVISLGSLIFRLFIAFIGYMLVNYALAMMGKPSVQWWVMRVLLPFGPRGF